MDPEDGAPGSPPEASEPGDPPPARPGLSTFTIEGRAAPGLFVVGWLTTISGLGLVLIGILAGSPIFLYLLGPSVLTIGLVAGAGNQAIERRARGAAYAGPSPYLVFATIIAATIAVASIVAIGLHLVVADRVVPEAAQDLAGISIQAVVFIGIIRLTVVGTEALSWAEMGWHRFDAPARRNLLLGIGTALPVIGVTSVVAYVLVSVFQQVPPSPLPPTGTAIGFLAQLLAGAVIAPVAEETVFRGFAITAWRRTAGETGAIVRASLIFALAHVITVSGTGFGEVVGLIAVGFVTRLPVAFALGWLFLRSRSIWAPLGLHMAFNAVLLILANSIA